ncbi:hypothetical protein FJQ98_10680 [Lysinibacillus agricola]|uniref:Uncharacterized protein n=1 Tax=Lysinibacillus agricola TaxID=2590012 RepID=A0ABX7AXA0_9BACI|nr:MULTISPECIES: hypothetical protein [Lysinibacillus]KOS60140.1 hypothetical protein AN161_23815 [Lysinibacillus sp. FJAT-14222]QQP14429.1 hypothetical protein FJQ98_10680 [Lysinibacillus agricola]
MFRTGIIFLILGLGAFILPQFGLQFKLFTVFNDIFGGGETFVEIALAGIGAVLVCMHLFKEKMDKSFAA